MHGEAMTSSGAIKGIHVCSTFCAFCVDDPAVAIRIRPDR
jgi:hypothetical protein